MMEDWSLLERDKSSPCGSFLDYLFDVETLYSYPEDRPKVFIIYKGVRKHRSLWDCSMLPRYVGVKSGGVSYIESTKELNIELEEGVKCVEGDMIVEWDGVMHSTTGSKFGKELI